MLWLIFSKIFSAVNWKKTAPLLSLCYVWEQSLKDALMFHLSGAHDWSTAWVLLLVSKHSSLCIEVLPTLLFLFFIVNGIVFLSWFISLLWVPMDSPEVGFPESGYLSLVCCQQTSLSSGFFSSAGILVRTIFVFSDSSGEPMIFMRKSNFMALENQRVKKLQIINDEIFFTGIKRHLKNRKILE